MTNKKDAAAIGANFYIFETINNKLLTETWF